MSSPETVATDIYTGFRTFRARFETITRRACGRFAARDWNGLHQDAVARLGLYETLVGETQARVARHNLPRPLWHRSKLVFDRLVSGAVDAGLAQTFYSSVCRRVLKIRGQAPSLEFTAAESPGSPDGVANPPYLTFRANGDLTQLPARLQQLLQFYYLGAPFAHPERDAQLAARRIGAALHQRFADDALVAIETLLPVFFRNTSAFVIARLRHASGDLAPLVFAFRHPSRRGVVLDAVLTTESSVSILFSFTHWYFHADIHDHPRVVAFLQTLIPSKRIGEIYISLGHYKHGKRELYRDISEHLARTGERFESAPGKRGMVMIVFTLPAYDVVFKVIRDAFDRPKVGGKQHVMDRYRLVFRHDRVGRLVDAQKFDQLMLAKDKFTPELRRELLTKAPHAVREIDGHLLFDHVYLQRRVTPLDVFVEQAAPHHREAAVLDYGRAIKELAAANVFPGDNFLKNYGVTRHGRVVFYDYDELTLLSECRFRRIPPPRTPEDELAAEPWFAVSDVDVFPEELCRFLGLRGELRELFLKHHGDLCTPDFWRDVQGQIALQGPVVDVLPYADTFRLQDKRR